MEELGGKISFASQPGYGTSFKIEFPKSCNKSLDNFKNLSNEEVS